MLNTLYCIFSVLEFITLVQAVSIKVYFYKQKDSQERLVPQQNTLFLQYK